MNAQGEIPTNFTLCKRFEKKELIPAVTEKTVFVLKMIIRQYIRN